MRLPGIALAVALVAACGARQSFVGTYSGEVTTTVGTGDAGAPLPAATETWVITSTDTSWPSKKNHHVVVTRAGDPACALDGVHGGGYELDLTPGQTCARGGRTATLTEGTLRGHPDLHLTLTWALAPADTRHDEGLLLQKK